MAAYVGRETRDFNDRPEERGTVRQDDRPGGGETGVRLGKLVENQVEGGGARRGERCEDGGGGQIDSSSLPP